MHLLRGGGEGGVVVQPQFIVKIVLDISVDQQTRTNEQTFEGVSDPQPPTGACGAATLIFGLFLAQLCKITVTCPKPIF